MIFFGIQLYFNLFTLFNRNKQLKTYCTVHITILPFTVELCLHTTKLY